MRIRDAVHENCSKCGRFVKELAPEEFGCDQCRTPIVPCGNDERLEVAVFYTNKNTERFYFCSWKCVFKFVKTVKTDHFFTLPYVCSDHKIKGRRAKDFQVELRHESHKSVKQIAAEHGIKFTSRTLDDI